MKECSFVSQTFTVSKAGSLWFVSLGIDAEHLPVRQSKESAGIDVGIKTFAALSNNQVIDASKPLKQAKIKLARLQGKAYKQVRGSNNKAKTYAQISRLHALKSCLCKDFRKQLTTYLAKTFKLLKIKHLNVQGMMADRKLAGAIADLGFYEFKRQIEYKCQV